MAERAALITGGSSGIGLAIARMLGEEGYGITLSARRPEKLDAAAEGLREAGIEVEAVTANVVEENDIVGLVASHRVRFGRLDVLVNNAGVGIGQPLDAIQTKHLDLQLAVNLRSYVIATREALPLLRQAGGEHGKALIVNTASVAGKAGQPWISVYSATKFAVVGFSQATQREAGDAGVQVTALCPGFVDTPMSEWVHEQIKPEEMIAPEDIAEAVRMLLRTSPNCRIPEIVFLRAGEALGAGPG
ncbi:MAG TPA: SDR family oxidoreductase [Solirubrobacterales bacterium]|nr:SDR family oxidoreductase [Solirubrobacterales bacterium]